jgi:N-carbamoyl-L-amino-acid hydrolase
MAYEALRVHGGRLQAALEVMSEIGKTEGGGVERLALTDEDRRARDLFVSWLRELELDVWIDEIGNIFGRLPGREDDLPVMAGSHLDTQPRGGRFDGTLGVLGALEAVRSLRENGITPRRPVIVVNWTNEEGTRFPPAMAGSGVWAGKLEKETILDSRDASGTRFGDELARIGYRHEVPAMARPFHAYFEYHIEQGPVLEREAKVIGVPQGIVAVHWFDVSVTGRGDHAGPTPMEARQDALVAASEMILAVNSVPERTGGDMVATVGEIRNRPNSRNVIPASTRFTIDMRCWDENKLYRAWDTLIEDFREIAGRHGCAVGPDVTWRVPRAEFEERLVDRVASSAEAMGYPVRRMASGAGHDASYMNGLAPTAMIFVPSVGGRSHVEEEVTTWEHCEAGANVLLQCILQTAME